MARVIRASSVKLHPSAGCAHCGWRQPSSALTREVAKDHAKRTGHSVLVETITRDLYRLDKS